MFKQFSIICVIAVVLLFNAAQVAVFGMPESEPTVEERDIAVSESAVTVSDSAITVSDGAVIVSDGAIVVSDSALTVSDSAMDTAVSEGESPSEGFRQVGADSVDIKAEHTPSLNEDFADDEVILTLKHAYSKINEELDISDFEDVKIEAVKDLTFIDEKLVSETDKKIAGSQSNDGIDISGENRDVERSLSDIVNIEKFHQIFSLKLKEKGKEKVLEAIAELEKREEVLAAEPAYDRVAADLFTPNDTLFTDQWGPKKIEIEKAWNISRGSTGVTVGILEEGCASHSDLNANMLTGRDVWNDVAIPFIPDAHGTHVAGIICAVANNSSGIAGVANVHGQILTGYGPSLSKVLIYAASTNIPIINASFHYVVDLITKENSPASTADFSAINNYPGLFVVAAGNAGYNNDGPKPPYPASYSCSNLISVASTDDSDNKAPSSNYSATKVHLGAPGVNILSTSSAGINLYGPDSGTSMAAPHVAGVAALIMSLNGNRFTTAQVKHFILNNVDKLSGLNGKCVTGGRLNAYKALTEAKTTRDYSADGKAIRVTDTNAVYIMAGGAPIYVSSWANVGGYGTPTDITRGKFNLLRKHPVDGTYLFTYQTTSNPNPKRYVVAGGAPVYISASANIPGAASAPSVIVDYVTINNAGGAGNYSNLCKYPADGAYVAAYQNVNSPVRYVFAGGAPVYISASTNIPGAVNEPSTKVDYNTINNAGGAGEYGRLNQYPEDGAYVLAYQNVNSPVRYVFAGGAPVYISSSSNIPGAVSEPSTKVDYTTINNAGGAGLYSKLRKYPADGAYVAAYQNVNSPVRYVFAGGAPLYISASANIPGAVNEPSTKVDYVTINNAGGVGEYGRLNQYPADGTYVYSSIGHLFSGISSTIFSYSGGVPTQLYSYDKLSSCQPATCVDMWAHYSGNTFATAYNWALDRSKMNTVGLNLTTSAKKDYIKFTAPVSGAYTFSSANCTGSLSGVLYDGAQIKLIEHTGTTNFSFTYSLISGQTYYLMICNANLTTTNTGTYNLNIVVP